MKTYKQFIGEVRNLPDNKYFSEDIVSSDRRIRVIVDPDTGQRKVSRKVTRRMNFDTPARRASREQRSLKLKQQKTEAGLGTDK